MSCAAAEIGCNERTMSAVMSAARAGVLDGSGIGFADDPPPFLFSINAQVLGRVGRLGRQRGLRLVVNPALARIAPEQLEVCGGRRAASHLIASSIRLSSCRPAAFYQAPRITPGSLRFTPREFRSRGRESGPAPECSGGPEFLRPPPRP